MSWKTRPIFDQGHTLILIAPYSIGVTKRYLITLTTRLIIKHETNSVILFFRTKGKLCVKTMKKQFLIWLTAKRPAQQAFPWGFRADFDALAARKLRGDRKKKEGARRKRNLFLFNSRGWENSRQLCKPSTSSRVCITVSNSPKPSRVYIRICKHGKRFLLLKCMIRVNGRSNLGLLAGMMNP